MDNRPADDATRLRQERDRLSADCDTLARALQELLQYVGGWDIKNPKHPIYIARHSLEGVLKNVR